VVGNPDRGYVLMDGATERIALRLNTDSRELVDDEADVLNALDERLPMREVDELWRMAHGVIPEDPPCLGDGAVAPGNDPHCRFAVANPLFHACTTSDGGPVRAGQSCWTEARTALMEAQFHHPAEQRDWLFDCTTAYDPEVAS